MSYSIESASDDCYPGTMCLINKLDIWDEHTLAKFEADISLARTTMLLSQPVAEPFNFEHYKSIHRFLFSDIYEWAGQLRTIDMSKKGTNFVKAASIEQVGNSAFGRLTSLNYFVGIPYDEFLENIVDFYDVLNMLHPFREGNGRTQRVFFTQLIRNAGYDINFADMNHDELMIATIQCANGISDYLRNLFRKHVTNPSC